MGPKAENVLREHLKRNNEQLVFPLRSHPLSKLSGAMLVADARSVRQQHERLASLLAQWVSIAVMASGVLDVDASPTYDPVQENLTRGVSPRFE
jgi:hypothetical protein